MTSKQKYLIIGYEQGYIDFESVPFDDMMADYLCEGYEEFDPIIRARMEHDPDDFFSVIFYDFDIGRDGGGWNYFGYDPPEAWLETGNDWDFFHLCKG